jgi:hypothetical protein
MDFTDIQQVCLNGHQITDSFHKHSDSRKDFCPQCGESTITQCQNCKADIPGHRYSDGVLAVYTATLPSHCHACGKPYPWTEKRQKQVTPLMETAAPNPISWVDLICERFHLVAKQLRQRHDNRPTLDVADEYDVQDLLHALLRLYFDDIRPEEWAPSYAGKSSRMDFILKGYGIVIETKKTRVGLGAKEVGDQLIIDIARYKTHPECKTLMCFVYDPDGRIANPKGIEKDLSRDEKEMKVKVVIVPRGY